MRNNEEPFDWCPVFYSPEFNALEEIRNRCTSTKLGFMNPLICGMQWIRKMPRNSIIKLSKLSSHSKKETQLGTLLDYVNNNGRVFDDSEYAEKA